MRKTIRFIGTWLLAITLLISCMSPMCVQAASNTKVAKTQKQLEKLLADKNTKTIKLIKNTNASSLYREPAICSISSSDKQMYNDVVSTFECPSSFAMT